MAEHLQRIEMGCAKEAVDRLRELRDEVVVITNQQSSLKQADDNCEQMAQQIRSRVK